jgi:hypothetical protein
MVVGPFGDRAFGEMTAASHRTHRAETVDNTTLERMRRLSRVLDSPSPPSPDEAVGQISTTS